MEGSAMLRLLMSQAGGGSSQKPLLCFPGMHGCSPVNPSVDQFSGANLSILRELLKGSKRACHYRAGTTGRTSHLPHHCFLFCEKRADASSRFLQWLVCDDYRDADAYCCDGDTVLAVAAGSGLW